MRVTEDREDGGAVDSLPTPAATISGPEQAATRIASEADVALHVVGEAVWAPSVHNTQPWWFTRTPAGSAFTRIPPGSSRSPTRRAASC